MTDEVAGPTVLRILLGTQLRRLREARGITAHDAARAIRASESKISRIELGRNAFREVDIADLLTLYGITDLDEREQMLSLASQANQPGWWHRYQDVLPGWFQSYIGLEESAEYSAAVLELGEFSLEETDRLVVLRKERQRRFTTGSLRLWAVIDEMALRRPVGSTELMRAQLEHLLEISDRPGLTLQVTPYPDGASHLVPGSFSILRFATADLPDVVYIEQLTSAMYLDKQSDVERYTAALDKVGATSTTHDQSKAFIRGLLGELTDSEETRE
jgi:transcriptional regulator with XRE-family HTH domain